MKETTKSQIKFLGIGPLLMGILFLSMYVIRPFLFDIRWELVANKDTIMVLPIYDFLPLLEIVAISFALGAICTYIYEILEYGIEKTSSNKIIFKKIIDKQKAKVTFFLSIIFVLISLNNYCIVDKSGITIKDITTLYFEKKYQWEDVKAVEIKNNVRRTKQKDVTYDLKYILVFEKYIVDLDAINETMFNRNYDKQFKQVHAIVKTEKIPVYINVEVYTKEFGNFLNIIGETIK